MLTLHPLLLSSLPAHLQLLHLTSQPIQKYPTGTWWSEAQMLTS